MENIARSDDGHNNIRMPEVSFSTRNPFPQLPSQSQKYFFSDPDADINRISSGFPGAQVLDAENSEHFSYAEANRLGTQASYIPVPHRCTVLCPPIRLPGPHTTQIGLVEIPHPHLRQNDLAFTMKMSGNSKAMSAVCPESPICQRSLPEPMVNMEVLNYILMGLQLYASDSTSPWKEVMWDGLELGTLDEQIRLNLLDPANPAAGEAMCTKVIRDCIRPFGVVAHDEYAAKSSATSRDEAASLIIDGEVRNMANYWVTSASRYFDKGGGRKKRKRYDPTSPPDSMEPGDTPILILRRVWIEDKSIELISAGEYGASGAQDGCAFYLPNFSHPREHKMLRFPTCDGVWLWQLVPSVESHLSRECWERMGYWRLGTCKDSVGIYDIEGEQPKKLQRSELEGWQGRSLINMTYNPVWTCGFKTRDDMDAFFRAVPAAPTAPPIVPVPVLVPPIVVVPPVVPPTPALPPVLPVAPPPPPPPAVLPEEEEEEAEEEEEEEPEQEEEEEEGGGEAVVAPPEQPQEEVVAPPEQPQEVVVEPEQPLGEANQPQEVVVVPEQPQEVVIAPEQPQEVVVEPEQPLGEANQPQEVVVVPEQPQEVVIAPEQPQEVVIAPEQPPEAVIAPEQPQEVVVAPEQPQEVVIAPEQPQEVVIAPEQPQGAGNVQTEPVGEDNAPAPNAQEGVPPVQPNSDEQGGVLPVQPNLDEQGGVLPVPNAQEGAPPIPDQEGVQQPNPDQEGVPQPIPDQEGVQQPNPDQANVQQPNPDQANVQQPNPDQANVQQPKAPNRIAPPPIPPLEWSEDVSFQEILTKEHDRPDDDLVANLPIIESEVPDIPDITQLDLLKYRIRNQIKSINEDLGIPPDMDVPERRQKFARSIQLIKSISKDLIISFIKEYVSVKRAMKRWDFYVISTIRSISKSEDYILKKRSNAHVKEFEAAMEGLDSALSSMARIMRGSKRLPKQADSVPIEVGDVNMSDGDEDEEEEGGNNIITTLQGRFDDAEEMATRMEKFMRENGGIWRTDFVVDLLRRIAFASDDFNAVCQVMDSYHQGMKRILKFYDGQFGDGDKWIQVVHREDHDFDMYMAGLRRTIRNVIANGIRGYTG